MNTIDIKAKKENFQYWLFEMENILEKFEKEFKEETFYNLNYSVESLLKLEEWILLNYFSMEDARNPKHKIRNDKIIRYIGKTFTQNIGGVWKLDSEDEKSAYYLLPIIVDYKNYTTPICPHRLFTACIDRKKGNFLSVILKNNL